MVLLHTNDVRFLRHWRDSLNDLYNMTDVNLLKATLSAKLAQYDRFIQRVAIGDQADTALTQADSEMPRVERVPCAKCGRTVATLVGTTDDKPNSERV